MPGSMNIEYFQTTMKVKEPLMNWVVSQMFLKTFHFADVPS